MVQSVAKAIRRLERRRIPHTRHARWYKTIRFFLVSLPLTVVAAVEQLIRFSASQIQGKRGEKPGIKLSNIIAGWTNLAFPNPKVEALARKRAAICAQCPLSVFSGSVYTVVVDNKTTEIRGMSCSACSCPLSAKVRAVSDSCPKGKW